MWFVVGICTLLSAVFYFADRYRQSGWNGEFRTHGGQRYEIKLTRDKQKNIRKVHLGVPCTTGLEFSLKRETWWDVTFKRLGLAQEQQLAHLRFDENIYVLSDDSRLSEALRLHPELVGELESLFARMNNGTLQVSRLWCMRQRLWIEASLGGWQMQPEQALQSGIDGALPVLAELASVLSRSVSSTSNARDFFVVKAVLLTGLSSGMAVNGLIHLIRLAFGRYPVLLDNLPLLAAALLLAAAIQTVLLALCFCWLDRTSRIQLVLLELILIGNFGAFSTSYMALRDYNIGFDKSAVQLLEVNIADRYSRKCGKRKRRTCYYMHFAGIPDYQGDLRLEVGQALYNQLLQYKSASLEVHAGALEMRWVGGVALPPRRRQSVNLVQ